MMGLQVIPMASFLVGIGITDEDLGIGEVIVLDLVIGEVLVLDLGTGEVLEHHGGGAVVEALIVMMVYLRVVVGVSELTIVGHGVQKAVGMIG